LQTSRAILAHLICLIALVAATRLCSAQDASEPETDDPTREIVRRMSKAALANNNFELHAALAELWTIDPKRAGRACVDLILKGDPHERPIAMELLGESATAEQLVAVVEMLNINQHADERRWLLRRVGAKEDASLDMLLPYLRDQDKYVQISAILSMADLGDLEAMRDLARAMPPAPSQSKWSGDKSDMVMMAKYGAVRTLTGLRPGSSTDVRRWLSANARALDTLAPPPPPDPAESFEFDNRTLQTPSLDIRFAAENYADVIKRAQIGSWAEFAVAMERSIEYSSRSAAPIFGAIHLPVIELILADQRTIAQYGGTSRGYLGFALGDRISMMFRDWTFVQGTLAHEYIHIIHSAHYEDQPRWLSEGLAESLTRSPTDSVWKRVGPDGNRRPVRAGAGFSRSITRWDSDGSTNEPPALYGQAHLFVDYLRFGFTCGDARLACLMGRLSRSDTTERAIEAVYGVSIDRMDEGLEEWLAN
jgi:hypothetical protein